MVYIGGGTGGPKGARGLPRNSLQPEIKLTFISKTTLAVSISSFYLEKNKTT